MGRKIRNIVSIALVIILIVPMTIQLFDGLFHEHENHLISNSKQESQVFEFHKECPIPNFELSFFSSSKAIKNKQKASFPIAYLEKYISEYQFNTIDYSFLLRAPPSSLKV